MIDCLTKVTASSLLAYAKHERIGLGNSICCSKTVIWQDLLHTFLGSTSSHFLSKQLKETAPSQTNLTKKLIQRCHSIYPFVVLSLTIVNYTYTSCTCHWLLQWGDACCGWRRWLGRRVCHRLLRRIFCRRFQSICSQCMDSWKYRYCAVSSMWILVDMKTLFCSSVQSRPHFF